MSKCTCQEKRQQKSQMTALRREQMRHLLLSVIFRVKCGIGFFPQSFRELGVKKKFIFQSTAASSLLRSFNSKHHRTARLLPPPHHTAARVNNATRTHCNTSTPRITYTCCTCQSAADQKLVGGVIFSQAASVIFSLQLKLKYEMHKYLKSTYLRLLICIPHREVGGASVLTVRAAV